ncbi:MAG: trigger factor [Candidatus Aminicenantes bacterium RBG_13_59_9]|nr:MAG: trigger factor [Candidatus Aminicenantes bacterium RBG_13_59_9]
MNDKAETITSRVGSPSPSKRELEIEVSAEEVAKEWDKVLLEYASRVRLDGFRRGKAPRDMVKRLFYPDIKDAVIENLVPRALRESLRAENISPVGTPVIREVVFLEGQPFRFKAVVEVLPGFELPPYTKIRVPKKEVKVEEEEVARSLEELRQKSAEYVPVEGRGVVDGDYVVVEWKGKDLKTKRFLPTEKTLVLAGHADNEKTLNDSLRGIRPGETRKFVISYPRDHAQKRLAGREIEYDIAVSSIKEKRVPELSDEWAKDLGEYESLAVLTQKVRQELEKAKQEASRREIGEEVVKGLVEKLQLELPQSLVDEEAVAILRSWATQLPAGLPSSQVEELKEKAREKARENLKTSLLLQKIAHREKLAVGDEEIEEEIKALARRNNVPLAQLVEKINQEGKREEIRSSLLLRKAIDFLVENAVNY